MGSTRPLEAFTFIFQETGGAPSSPMPTSTRPARSTWVFETDATPERRRLDQNDEEANPPPYGGDLRMVPRGPPVLANRSIWRNFPMIRNKRWVLGNMVLLGDAKATRPFLDRLGHQARHGGRDRALRGASGARIGRWRARSAPTRPAGARRSRRPSTPPTCPWLVRACRPLLGFRPRSVRLRGQLTRAKAITYDNLRLRAPDSSTTWTALRAPGAGRGFDVPVDQPPVPMFQPFRCGT